MPAIVRSMRPWRTLATLLLVLCVLPACSATSGPRVEPPVTNEPAPAAKNNSFTLVPGTSHATAGGTLAYERMISDSRCPPERMCVWAGDAVLAFSWTARGAAPTTFQLHTGLEPRSHRVDGHRVVLEDLARGPAPAATLRIEPAD